MAGKIIGSYEIQEEIGRGGMGIVFKAYQLSLDREVALKVLPRNLSKDKALINRFFKEAESVAKLNHPNIVTIYDIGESGGLYYFSMELLNGRSLQDIIEEKGPLSLKSSLDIVIQVTDALSCAHNKGIIHRDIKSANILIDQNKGACITDFGIAKAIIDTKYTKSGMYLGSPGYMSPEQAKGEDVDHRSDLYSLGIVLFQIMTGNVPFKGENPIAVAYKHINEPVPSIKILRPDIPDRICKILLKLLAKNPNKRYQSTGDLLKDFQKINMSWSRLDKNTQSGAEISRRNERIVSQPNRFAYFIGALLCIVALILIFILLQLIE